MRAINRIAKLGEAVFLGGREGLSLLYRYACFRFFEREFVLNTEVTFKCGNNCKYCYFEADLRYKIQRDSSFREKMKDLPIEFWQKEFLNNFKKGNSLVITGGEPAKRPDVLKMAYEMYQEKLMIVTNGTERIPDEVQCRIFASINGPREVHNKMARKDAFDAAAENIRGDKRIILSPVLSTVNYEYIEYLVKLAMELGVSGVTFSFYTPQKLPEGQIDPLLLEGEKLKRAVQDLHRVLDEYPDVVFLTHGMIDLFESKEHKNGCNLKRGWVKTLDPRGEKKGPCVMGENIDCDNCGCEIPVLMRDLENLNRKAVRVAGMFSYKP